MVPYFLTNIKEVFIVNINKMRIKIIINPKYPAKI